MRALSLMPADRHFTGAFLLVAFAFIILEFAYGRLAHHDEMHDTKETLASVGVALGNVVTKALTSGLSAVPFFLVYQHRLTDIPLDSVWKWLSLFLGVEFFYYWFHLASHRIRWLWATHAVHHSATRFNLSAAVRLGWTGQLTGGFLFFLPLAWIGFHPAAIAAMLEIFGDDDLSVDFDLEPGQMQFVHNRALGHSRTAFVDHPDPDRKRHLVRLWMRDQGRRAYPG